MSRYTVRHRYRAVLDHQAVQLEKGSTVDLDDAQAEWVNRDSPGCLEPERQKRRSRKDSEGDDG